ncbi:EAL domain-containing protein [Aeromonas salmonicida]|mgnify:CR=1 FL=1|jgi:EAL domain-containing protein (putative c-di-GMP-specific phosphodiesterase class I)/GGDEF domain-containing protein|uniref:GGDEF domain-containing protein n=3 Tax=Gammaproteobacteria TaxID=1236 RepID=A0A3L0VVX4_ECOLX|nr:GGDEF domain-containing protein [Aeromonas salmonicida]ARW81868.1 GGDEF domain protein [Aeromonas salmonicida]MDR6993582.1 EAL domain-containing protein (putative c-di-GMP-specific phosphodiesterase class I)/GGDEF domain-containing protein [Aeromonas salmonicida]PBO07946.1 GGDEF domain-containing protein [Aeromonas salmonicida]UUI59090.1 GGDEF domain-containing protein [Aeromonas salmonicida]HAT06852.1 GGDEF domain-containing protein [Aeromonas salmonicida]
MLNKLGSNLLLIAAVTCAPLLLLQGIWLAAQATPLTLTLILGTSLLGFGLLFMLAYRARNAERAQQDRVWIKALQLRDPAVLETAEAQAALQQLLSHFNEADLDAHRQIDELHNLATQDELTQLQNRHAFRRDMTALLQRDQDTQTATLVLIRATELGKLNAQRGFQSGDAYIKDIANLITRVVSRFPGHQVYRISGADFAVLVQPVANIPPPLLGRDLKIAFDHYQQQHELESAAYSGLTRLSSGQKIEAILARADLALARAQTETVNGWAIQQDDDEVVDLQGQHHWKLVLNELLDQERISFTYQPIQSMHRSMLAYNEIYTRFSSADGTVLPTDTLFAMAQRLDMVMKLEQMLVVHIMRQYRAFGANQSRWGINLSSNLLQNSTFLIWLDRQLLKDPNTSANLVFELDEEHLERNMTGAKRVFELLRRNGSRSAICNFGKGIGSFNLFRELKPDYIKLDPALITGLEQDLTNQQFVRMIVDVSHRMGCQVIAEGVEQLGQKQLLQGMYVDGLQGYLIARPQPLRPDISQLGLFTEDVSTSAESE